MRNITLVLGGSGLCYPAYVGAIYALLEHNLYPGTIHAVSGGALVGALFASGYGRHSGVSQLSLKDVVLQTLPEPNKLYDKSWMPATKKYGIYKGNSIENTLRHFLKSSFYDMVSDLNVYCTDIQRSSTIVFNRRSYELLQDYELDVAKCVRASMSLPFVFEYVECKSRKNGSRMILIDGGVTNNFPMDVASYGQHTTPTNSSALRIKNHNVIGIRIQSSHESSYNAKCTASLPEFAKATLFSMMETLENQHVPTELWDRVITIQTQASSMNLNLNVEEANDLFQEGYDQTTIALRTRIVL